MKHFYSLSIGFQYDDAEEDDADVSILILLESYFIQARLFIRLAEQAQREVIALSDYICDIFNKRIKKLLKSSTIQRKSILERLRSKTFVESSQRMSRLCHQQLQIFSCFALFQTSIHILIMIVNV